MLLGAVWTLPVLHSWRMVDRIEHEDSLLRLLDA
jgi:hypothetical protein